MKVFKEKMCFCNILLISTNFNLGPSFQENINTQLLFFFFFLVEKVVCNMQKKKKKDSFMKFILSFRITKRIESKSKPKVT